MRSDDLLSLIDCLGFRESEIRKTYTSDGDLNVMVCCPFHSERKPSCGISALKERGQCFSCGETFNIVKFTSACLEIPYNRAEEFLDEKFNVSFKRIEQYKISRYKENNLNKDRREFLNFYNLAPYKSGKIYHEYLKNRGISKETCKKFLIGWNNKTFRFTIPIFYLQNKLMGFLTRAALDRRDRDYNYIYGNSDTYLVENFKRSSTLFPINFFPKKEKTAILVEGSFDAMRMHQLGFNNTLSLLTSKISRGQIELLDILGVRNVILFLDNDSAGLKGTEIIFNKLKGLFNVYCVDYTDSEEGIDPAGLSLEEINSFLDNLSCVPIRKKLKRMS